MSVFSCQKYFCIRRWRWNRNWLIGEDDCSDRVLCAKVQIWQRGTVHRLSEYLLRYIKSMMIYVVEYAGSVLQKKQKEISQKIKFWWHMRLYVIMWKVDIRNIMRQHLTKNKIKLDLNAPNIGEHIWAVMNILFTVKSIIRKINIYVALKRKAFHIFVQNFPK